MVIFHIRNLTPVCSDPRLLISKNLDHPAFINIPLLFESKEYIFHFLFSYLNYFAEVYANVCKESLKPLQMFQNRIL